MLVRWGRGSKRWWNSLSNKFLRRSSTRKFSIINWLSRGSLSWVRRSNSCFPQVTASFWQNGKDRLRWRNNSDRPCFKLPRYQVCLAMFVAFWEVHLIISLHHSRKFGIFHALCQRVDANQNLFLVYVFSYFPQCIWQFFDNINSLITFFCLQFLFIWGGCCSRSSVVLQGSQDWWFDSQPSVWVPLGKTLNPKLLLKGIAISLWVYL